MTGPIDAPSPVEPGWVEVVYALPDRQRVVRIRLPTDGMTAGEALDRSALRREFPELDRSPAVLGIYGVTCEPSRPLRDGDRVEVYRPLRNDPRAARRARVAEARARPARGR
jgi:putative ubiquitin-RnfH superfamily antitoxin RatB of RatAB toxin-antitoxin module